MNVIQRTALRLVGVALKAAGRPLAFVASGLANLLWLFDTTWQSLIKQGYGLNSVVYACVRLLSQSVPEARLTAYQGEGEDRKELDSKHPLRLLLKAPNPLTTTFEMLELATIQLAVVGRTVWWKERSQGGQPIALWPLRPDRVAPVYGDNARGEDVLLGFAYGPPDGTTPKLLRLADVVFVNFPDPDGESGGLVEGFGPLSAIARQVAADNQATTHVGSLLANYAQPGVALEMLDGPSSEEEANLIKAKFRQEFGGQRLGVPAIVGAGTKIVPLGFTLRDLEFPELRANAEARICGAMGVPAILAGTKVGLDRATYSNAAEARQFFAESTLSWYWRRYADAFTNQLAVEFGEGISVDFDTSEVRALAGQKIERLTPIKDAWTSGVATRNQYLAALGLDPLPPEYGDVFLVPNSGTITPATDEARAALQKRADEEAAKQKEQQEAEQERALELAERQRALNPPPERPQLPPGQSGEPGESEPASSGQEEEEEAVGASAVPARARAARTVPAGKSLEGLVVIPLDAELEAALGLVAVGSNGHANGHNGQAHE